MSVRGYVYRKEDLGKTVLTGRASGNRERDRERFTVISKAWKAYLRGKQPNY